MIIVTLFLVAIMLFRPVPSSETRIMSSKTFRVDIFSFSTTEPPSLRRCQMLSMSSLSTLKIRGLGASQSHSIFRFEVIGRSITRNYIVHCFYVWQNAQPRMRLRLLLRRKKECQLDFDILFYFLCWWAVVGRTKESCRGKLD